MGYKGNKCKCIFFSGRPEIHDQYITSYKLSFSYDAVHWEYVLEPYTDEAKEFQVCPTKYGLVITYIHIFMYKTTTHTQPACKGYVKFNGLHECTIHMSDNL